MNKEKQVFIFCQAPADVPYVLSIYEENKGRSDISIFVINVLNVFKFLEEQNLKIKQIVFIPYKITTFKKVSLILIERRRIKALKNTYFKDISQSEIYFFSRFEDWLTASFISFLGLKNTIYYLDHYDAGADIFKRRTLSFKTIILKVIYWLMTGVNFNLEISEKLPEFLVGKLKNIQKISMEIDPNIFDKYSYKINDINEGERVVMAFVSPCEDVIYKVESHDQIQYKVFKLLKDKGYKIIVKGHPRLGIPLNIGIFVDEEIPVHIPAEFIQLSNVSFCMGIITTAIVHFAKYTTVPTYSLINLFEFTNTDYNQKYQRYLNELSCNNVLYFKDEEDFYSRLA